MNNQWPTPEEVERIKQRLLSNIEILPWSGCWIWMGGVRGSNDYGRISIGNRDLLTHRVSWEVHNGRQIPDGLLACHSCDVPPCINPNHIWPGTNEQNLNDRFAKLDANIWYVEPMWQYRKTHCKNGHEYNEANTNSASVGPTKRRRCRVCQRMFRIRYRQKLQAIRALPNSGGG